MSPSLPNEEAGLDAGGFTVWLGEISSAVRGQGVSDVPCGDCTACCTSSQFIHISPDEAEALASIPPDLVFPAPGLPAGYVLMGYDEHGRCPMLVDGACSIYEHRPRTCRTYDCRVFAAAGVAERDASKAEVARRVERWRFRYVDEVDRVRHEAVRAAARRLEAGAALLPADARPSTSGQLALLALAVHEVFLRANSSGEVELIEPDQFAFTAAVEAASGSGDRSSVDGGR